jgi:hypothetical protein
VAKVIDVSLDFRGSLMLSYRKWDFIYLIDTEDQKGQNLKLLAAIDNCGVA